MNTTRRPTTHERHLHALRDLVITRAVGRKTVTADHASGLRIRSCCTAVGDGTCLGVTVFDPGEKRVERVDVVEIAASGQESWIQLAGTVIHELGHEGRAIKYRRPRRVRRGAEAEG